MDDFHECGVGISGNVFLPGSVGKIDCHYQCARSLSIVLILINARPVAAPNMAMKSPRNMAYAKATTAFREGQRNLRNYSTYSMAVPKKPPLPRQISSKAVPSRPNRTYRKQNEIAEPERVARSDHEDTISNKSDGNIDEGSLGIFLSNDPIQVSSLWEQEAEENHHTSAKEAFTVAKKERKRNAKNKWAIAKKVKTNTGLLAAYRRNESGPGGMRLALGFSQERTKRLPTFSQRRVMKENMSSPTRYQEVKRNRNRIARQRLSLIERGVIPKNMIETTSIKNRSQERRGNIMQIHMDNHISYGEKDSGHKKSAFFDKLKQLHCIDQRAITPMTHYMRACEDLQVVPMPFYLQSHGKGDPEHVTLKHLNIGDRTISAICDSVNMAKIVKVIDLTDNNITAVGAEALLRQLSSTVEVLILKSNRIGLLGAQSLRHVLMSPVHQNLKYLNLSHNKLGDKASLLVMTALIHSRNVQRLEMADNGLEKHCCVALAALLRSKNCQLLELDISGNHLTASDFSCVVKAFEVNETVWNLNMSHNQGIESSPVEDLHAAMHRLSQVLEVNRSLKHFDLSGNNLSFECVSFFRPGLMKNHTLLGFHHGHNQVRIDSFGYLTPLLDEEQFERLDGHIQSNTAYRGRRDCCHVCGQYVQILLSLDLRCTSTVYDEDTEVYVHVSSKNWNDLENYNPYPLAKFGNQHGIKINVPVGAISFFFSVNGTVVLSNIHETVVVSEDIPMTAGENGVLFPSKDLFEHDADTVYSVHRVNRMVVKHTKGNVLMPLRSMKNSILEHHEVDESFVEKNIESHTDHHEHAVVTFEHSMFYNKDAIRLYHTKFKAALLHDWNAVKLPVRKLISLNFSAESKIDQVYTELFELFKTYFGVLDRLYRLYSEGPYIFMSGFLKFLSDFRMVETCENLRFRRVMKKLGKQNDCTKNPNNSPSSATRETSMFQSLTDPRIKRSGRKTATALTSYTVQKNGMERVPKNVAEVTRKEVNKSMAACFSAAVVGIDISDDLLFELYAKKESHLERPHFFVALLHLSRELDKKSPLLVQFKNFMDLYVIGASSESLREEFAIKHLFVKRVEHVFKDYEFGFKKLYTVSVRQYHMTVNEFLTLCELIFGVHIDKTALKHAFNLSHVYPTHARNEMSLQYPEFLEAFSRYLMTVDLVNSKLLEHMLNVKMPFETGRSRNIYKPVHHVASPWNPLPLVERLLIVFNAIFGRTYTVYFDDDDVEEDYFSSSSCSSESEGYDHEISPPHSPPHCNAHHRSSHQLHVGTHATIELHDHDMHKVRKACMVTSLNIDDTVDVIVSRKHSKRRQMFRGVSRNRIFGRRHTGFECEVQKNTWKAPRPGEIINVNPDGSYDVELTDGLIASDVLEEEIFPRVSKTEVNEKQQWILRRFARKVKHKLHLKLRNRMQNQLGEKILLLSTVAGYGNLSEQRSIDTIKEIKAFLIANKEREKNFSTEAMRAEERNKIIELIGRVNEVIDASTEKKVADDEQKLVQNTLAFWSPSGNTALALVSPTVATEMKSTASDERK